MSEICEFWVSGPASVAGWDCGYCSLERTDQTFDATRDCVKRVCKLHRPDDLDLLLVLKKAI